MEKENRNGMARKGKGKEGENAAGRQMRQIILAACRSNTSRRMRMKMGRRKR